MMIKENYDEYMCLKKNIFESLRLTMYNLKCLPKDLVDDVIDEYLNDVTIEDEVLFYDDEKLNFHSLVAQIKRSLNTRS